MVEAERKSRSGATDGGMNLGDINEGSLCIAPTQHSTHLSSIDSRLIDSYKDLIGEAGIDLFQELVLKKAKSALGDLPNIYEDVVTKLVNSASYLTEDRLIELLTTHISDLSFRIHRDFQPNPPGVTFSDLRLHINSAAILNGLSSLIPQYLLNGRQFDQEDFEYDPDFYSVCFTGGSSPSLARFLVGHELLDAGIGWRKKVLEADALSFFLESCIAVALPEQSSLEISGEHECESLFMQYGPECGYVSVYRSIKPVEVKLLKIPATVFTEDELKLLRLQGVEYYRRFSSNKNWQPPSGIASEDEVAELYSHVRKLELLVEYFIRNTFA